MGGVSGDAQKECDVFLGQQNNIPYKGISLYNICSLMINLNANSFSGDNISKLLVYAV